MPDSKILDPQQAQARSEELWRRGASVVFTNGVFDLLHPGHVQYLQEAREMGSHLFVAVNTDESVKRIKGDKRPIMPLPDRMEVLAALESVSVVTWFDEDTPAEIIRLIRPQVLVKGGDWKLEQIVGREFVESSGGVVRTIPFLPGYSTSEILKKIAKL